MTGPIFPQITRWLHTTSSFSKDVFENLPHGSPPGFKDLKKVFSLYVLLVNRQGGIMKLNNFI